MGHQLWKSLERHLAGLASPSNPRRTYQGKDVVRVSFWAVLHGRPTRWACGPKNWPAHARKRPLPSPSQVSRRPRGPSVLEPARRLDRAALAPRGLAPLLALVDGKPLAVSGVGKDRQASYGRAAAGMAKGHKPRLTVASGGPVPSWRVAPVSRDERAMGRRPLRDAEAQGYVVAGGSCDDNRLHGACLKEGERQRVAPCRMPGAKGPGRQRQGPGRVRGLEMARNKPSGLGRGLLRQRQAVERHFGQLTSFAGGLSPLPAWARARRRVRRWAQAKLVFNRLRMDAHGLTCVA